MTGAYMPHFLDQVVAYMGDTARTALWDRIEREAGI